jgi:hypothetical protein
VKRQVGDMKPDKKKVDKYYALLNEINKLRRDKKYHQMLEKCQLSWPLIEPVINWHKVNNPEKKARLSIPAIEIACPFLAAYGSIKMLSQLQTFVYNFPDLSYYRLKVDDAFIMCWLANRICWKAKTSNGVLQKDLPKYLNFKNVKIIYFVVDYLEKIGRVKKEKKGTTYLITC